jgi:hypothetical protein
MQKPRQSALSRWNLEFETGHQTLSSEAWDEWLWGTDLHEKLTPVVSLNKAHLLGLLIARYKGRHHPECMQVRLFQLYPEIVHGQVAVQDQTLRQLRDTLEDLQIHWPLYTGKDWQAASQAVDAVMARFGQLNLAPHHPALRDDPASLDPERPGWISLAAIRRFTSLLCVLYRHLDLAAAAEELEPVPGLLLPPPTESPSQHSKTAMTGEMEEEVGEEMEERERFGIESHHVQAGLDEFYIHSMLADIPPAARLIYKQDFQGMYHCVTQVVYMHYPNYDRRSQVSLEALRAGTGATAVNALSVLLQLEPDEKLVYEDDALEKDGWTWMLLTGGTVYLISPWRGVIYTSRCVWTLLDKQKSIMKMMMD